MRSKLFAADACRKHAFLPLLRLLDKPRQGCFRRCLGLLALSLSVNLLMAQPERLSLNGPWQVAITGSEHWLPAAVPGCIQTDLLAAGKIPDPFFRDNEKQVAWVAQTNWTYRRTFSVPKRLLAKDRVLLRCEGLDTLATLRVNGQEVAKTDNMFRTWEFDVKRLLKAGENFIEIAFESPLPYMRQRNATRTLYEWSGPHEPTGRAWLRKAPYSFGWDWGTVVIPIGIWRNIGLVAFDEARLADVLVLQDHSRKGTVTLKVEVSAEMMRDTTLKAAITVKLGRKKIAATTLTLNNGKCRAELAINDPQLWWPAGMGKQPLYEVRVELLNAKGKRLDGTVKRIGLRTIELLPQDDTNSLRFAVNDVPFFAKGANWIPADQFPNRVTPAKLRRYMEDAVAVNMNSVRFWGGGYYEEDELYDCCDELGLLVWSDFKFACSSYPAFDTAFMENVRQEVRDNVRRLRHHACIAAWCGNNEISLMTKPEWSDKSMGKADYDRLFSGLIADEVKALAPQANYVPGSPEVGDIHYWQVWHGGKPFEDYRTLNGFMSEFGFQSFPEPATVYAYTSAADRDSVFSPIMQWHQRSSGNGNQKMRDLMVRYFNEPKDFDSTLWLSQIVQAYGIKLGAEFWRQNMPKSMGCIYWQYNDCWPVASWSSVDYFGRWKALHYAARHFYAPLLVSGLENPTNNTMHVFVTSDQLQPARGTLTWEVTDAGGVSLLKESKPLDIPAQLSRRVGELDFSKLVAQHGAGNLIVWLKLEVAGKTVSQNMVTLAYPKALRLVNPQLKPDVKRFGNGFIVTLTVEHPALWTWLSLDGADARYSDNFVHVRPGVPVEIQVTPNRKLSKAEFIRALSVQSLLDTYAR